MYLRTPKRYRPGHRRQLRLFSGRRLVLLLVIPAVAYAGWYIWNNQNQVRSAVLPHIETFAASVQTQVAPHPTPSATPDLAVAQAGCLNASERGSLEDAIKQCTVIAEGYPNDVNLYYRLTHMLIVTSNFGRDSQRLAEALDYAEKTINANPEAPQGWAIRAMALDWNKDYGGALASALHAKALDPNFAPTYAFLGEVYIDLGDYNVASGYLDQARDLDTSGVAIVDTFRNQGLWYMNQGYYEDALQPYQVALQNAPNYSYVAIELAANYNALQETEKALGVLASALERNPTDSSLLFNLANAYLRNGDVDKANEYYRRCLDLDANNVPCLSFLGGLQFSEGDYVTAAANLERAIQLGSTDPDDFYQLGHSQAAMGHCDLAIPYFQQGYQIAVERDDEARQTKFMNELQACGALNTQPSGDTG
jgi:tetratricopeptide (TPR) repeat protein